MIRFIKRHSLYFAWLIALVSTLMSLYYSEVLSYSPCEFCWYQRVFMFSLVIVLAIAAYKGDIKIFPYIITLPIIGAVIALWQTIFTFFDFSSFLCASKCLEENVRLFGTIDFSILSFLAFAFITLLLFVAKGNKEPSKKRKR